MYTTMCLAPESQVSSLICVPHFLCLMFFCLISSFKSWIYSDESELFICKRLLELKRIYPDNLTSCLNLRHLSNCWPENVVGAPHPLIIK